MRINLYDDGSYDVDHGWKPPFYQPYKQYRGRTIEAGTQDDFLWETDKGVLIAPEDMATPHLINAINMIWRNVFELKTADRPEILGEWSSVYVDRAARELTAELQKRVEAV